MLADKHASCQQKDDLYRLMLTLLSQLLLLLSQRMLPCSGFAIIQDVPCSSLSLLHVSVTEGSMCRGLTILAIG